MQEWNLFHNYKEEYKNVKYFYFKDINSKAKTNINSHLVKVNNLNKI